MSEKTIRVPGPDHPITIERNVRRVIVTVAGKVIADTTEALALREANYPPVQYIPRHSVDMAELERSEHATYCPFKGDAGYFSVPSGAYVRTTRSGPMRRLTGLCPRSRIIWRSIPTASILSRKSKPRRPISDDRHPPCPDLRRLL